MLTGDDDNNFSGDTVTTVWFVRPAEDGVDCESDTLVIEINTPALGNIFDEETGELIQARSPGLGTVSTEPSEQQGGEGEG